MIQQAPHRRGRRSRTGARQRQRVSASSPSPETAEGGATIAVVTHGQASDPFWSVFKRGVDDAAAQMGATANYSAPATFDMVEMASLIDAAVATNPTGSSCRCPTTRRSRTRSPRPTRRGSRSSRSTPGRDHYQEIGAITHVGQDETIAGRAAGRTPRRSRGDARDVHQPGGRQRRARCPLRRRRRVDRGSRRHARGRAGRPQRPGRSAEHDQLDVAGRRHDRRDARPRPDRRRHRRWPPSTSSARPATSSSARSTSAPT